jgi:hypothetical protein
VQTALLLMALTMLVQIVSLPMVLTMWAQIA